MGIVINEETGNEPCCIYCGSTDDCPHLVASIDRTFAECYGGIIYDAIDKLEEILASRIARKLKAEKDFKFDAVSYDIASIVKEAVSQYDDNYPDEVYVDGFMFFEWLVDALIDAGAEEPHRSIIEEGGPGQSTVLTLLYAKHPKQVLNRVEKVLRNEARLL